MRGKKNSRNNKHAERIVSSKLIFSFLLSRLSENWVKACFKRKKSEIFPLLENAKHLTFARGKNS